MRMRWMAALAAAVAVAAAGTTLWLSSRPRPKHPAKVPSSAACPVGAKTANLNFTMTDMSGRSVRLEDFKGKVILLDFWATWCGPCKFEIPGFVELQNQYGKDGLQVIGVSVDDTVEKLQPFVKQFKMNYPVLLGLGHDDVQDAYGPLIGIPVSVIISRDGKICAKHMGLPPSKSDDESLEKSVRKTFEAEIKALL